jgi:sugar lactone lactonase YvrE
MKLNHLFLFLAATASAFSPSLVSAQSEDDVELNPLERFRRDADHRSLDRLPSDRPAGALQVVAEFRGPIVTGIAISAHNRIFVSFPRWTDPVEFTVGEVRNGRPVAYPNAAWNDPSRPPADRLISVQSVVVDAQDHLWILDSGSINQGPIIPGGPKLLAVDLATNQVVKKISFPESVVKTNSYLNDVRFDLRRGAAGVAFITDSSPQSGNAIIVVDLASGQSLRRLEGHPSVRPEPDFVPVVEGRPLYVRPPDGPPQHFLTGSDGLALNADGSRLFYSPLSSRKLYSASVDALADPAVSDAQIAATVQDHGDKGTGADGLEFDNRNRLYITAYEHNSVLRRTPDGLYETVVHSPHILWPDGFAISRDGYLYFTVNQLHRQPRFHRGQDLREKPWVLFRTKIDAGPVLLAPTPIP